MPDRMRAGRINLFLGETGEKIAELFLKKKGWRIIDKNFRTPFGEIDLVAEDNRTIVFIEVKTRISKNFGPPVLSITETKKKTIIKNAIYYLKKFYYFDSNARIDIIAINLAPDGSLEKLEHMKSAIWIE